jgi:hypothetical protein
LVVVVLSPDAIKSSWVLYEWHNSLLIQQHEPFLIHYRKCQVKELKRITDYQLPAPLVERGKLDGQGWSSKQTEISQILDAISLRLEGFSKLKGFYRTLTNIHVEREKQQEAAYELGNVSEGLKLAASNYLIEALQFWLSHGINGYVGASIANELGQLGKKKAIPSLTQLFLSQANGGQLFMPALNAVQRALGLLSCE